MSATNKIDAVCLFVHVDETDEQGSSVSITQLLQAHVTLSRNHRTLERLQAWLGLGRDHNPEW